MKTFFLAAVIGLLISFNLSIIGCGQKGDLVRPLPPQPASPSEENQDKTIP